MVEGNENTNNESDSPITPRRRGGLFGSRRGGRGRAAQVQAEPAVPAASVKRIR